MPTLRQITALTRADKRLINDGLESYKSEIDETGWYHEAHQLQFTKAMNDETGQVSIWLTDIEPILG